MFSLTKLLESIGRMPEFDEEKPKTKKVEGKK